MTETRIGQGIDIHPFDASRPLWLGGVHIPGVAGLAGHSDADVLLHAITDGVLGALAWGDIGRWYPNTDEQWRGAASAVLLDGVWQKAASEGWRIGNVDSMVLAEAPKISPFVDAMRARIGEILGTEPGRISIKATTAEGLGFVGRAEGMTATAVVLLTREG